MKTNIDLPFGIKIHEFAFFQFITRRTIQGNIGRKKHTQRTKNNRRHDSGDAVNLDMFFTLTYDNMIMAGERTLIFLISSKTAPRRLLIT